MTTPAELIEEYNKTKAFLDGQVKAFDEYAKPFKEKLESLRNQLLAIANSQGVNSFSTDAGTAYVSTILNLKIVDRDQYLKFVTEWWNEYGNAMLQVGATKDAVKEYLEKVGTPPPGIETSYFNRMNINRG